MNQTMLIKITNKKALKLLHELEQLNLIKVLKENGPKQERNLARKYRGIISKEEGADLKKHGDQMRSEWNDI